MARSARIIIAALARLFIWSMGCAGPVTAADYFQAAENRSATCPLQSKVGEAAPKFSLDAVIGKGFKKVSLTDYRGKWVVLSFYPLDFTFVCPTEIRGFKEKLDAFKELNAAVLGPQWTASFPIWHGSSAAIWAT